MKIFFLLSSIFLSISSGAEGLMCQGPFHTHQTSSAVEVAMVRTTAKLFAAADRPYWAFRAARLKRHVLTDENECESPNTSTVGSSKSLSNFEKTSNPVKAVVSSLTNMFVWISGEFITDDLVQGADRDNPERSPLSVEELEAEIRQEYAKNYLWTGNINENLYEMNCSFTDPTLSFSGIETYKRNIASLQGVLDALVSDSSSILNSCTLRQEEFCVETKWRMIGDLRLPWGPTIDVKGRTKFSYNPDRGNRISSYDEVWEVEPATALMQLLKPGRDRRAPLPGTDPQDETSN